MLQTAICSSHNGREKQGREAYLEEGCRGMNFSTAESQAVLESRRMIAVAVFVTYGWMVAFSSAMVASLRDCPSLP